MSQLVFPEVQAELRAEANATARRHRRIASAAASTGVLALAAVAAFALAPASRPGGELLGPQAAVAAINENLAGDGILEWRRTTTHAEQRPGEGAAVQTRTTETWADLRTGVSRSITRTTGAGTASTGELDPDLREDPDLQDAWSNEDGVWHRLQSADGKHFVSFLPLPMEGDNSPLAYARGALKQARKEGRSITEVEFEGEPALRLVGKQRDPRMTHEMWLSRDPQPRLLGTRSTRICSSGPACKPMRDGRPRADVILEERTTTWKIHRRTPQALRAVERPGWASAKRAAAPRPSPGG